MRAAIAAIALLVPGCNQIFGLHDVDSVSDADLHAGCSKPGEPRFHDEDGDTFPDDCDNCPGIANTDQSDVLEMQNGQMPDGVGDVCDPSPGITGDQIVSFISFDEAGVMARIEPRMGSWRVANGALAVDGNGSGNYLRATLVDAPPAIPYALETHAKIDAMDPTVGSTHELNLFADFVSTNGVDPTNGTASCEINRGWAIDNTPKDTTLADLKGMGTDETPLGNSKLGPDAGYVLRASVQAKRLACRMDGDLGDAGSNTQDGTLPVGKIGFETQNMAIHYDYLVVYDLSGEPAP